jgi:hypothetical protein
MPRSNFGPRSFPLKIQNVPVFSSINGITVDVVPCLLTGAFSGSLEAYCSKDDGDGRSGPASFPKNCRHKKSAQ